MKKFICKITFFFNEMQFVHFKTDKLMENVFLELFSWKYILFYKILKKRSREKIYILRFINTICYQTNVKYNK